MNRPRRHRSSRGFTLVELMIVVAVIGILASFAIPNFMRIQARVKQSEAKANLRALYVAQAGYFHEKDRFTQCLRRAGFLPERGNRYMYALNAGTTSDGCTATSNRAVVNEPNNPLVARIPVDTAKFPFATATPAIPAAAMAF